MDRESLRPREDIDVRCKLRRRLGGNLHGGDLAAEDAWPERPGEVPGATGRQHVVGAGDVVAKGGCPEAPDENATGGADAVGELGGALLEELEVLGSKGVGEVDRVAEVGYLDQRQRRVADALALRRRPLGGGGHGVEYRLLDRDGDQWTLGAVLGLSTEVQGGPLGVGAVAGDEHQLGG